MHHYCIGPAAQTNQMLLPYIMPYSSVHPSEPRPHVYTVPDNVKAAEPDLHPLAGCKDAQVHNNRHQPPSLQPLPTTCPQQATRTSRGLDVRDLCFGPGLPQDRAAVVGANALPPPYSHIGLRSRSSTMTSFEQVKTFYLLSFPGPVHRPAASTMGCVHESTHTRTVAWAPRANRQTAA